MHVAFEIAISEAYTHCTNNQAEVQTSQLLVTGPFDRAYRDGLGCQDVDALKWGVVEMVGSTSEKRTQKIGGRPATSEFN